MMRSVISFLIFSLVIGATPVLADDLDAAAQHLRTGEYQKAYALLQPLAEKGNPAAQRNLGVMYLMGDGVTRDFEKSRVWLEKAAGQGQVPAMVVLSNMYRGSEGHPLDSKQAVRWLKQAANADDLESMNRLGILHYDQKEYDQALVWFRKAADRNHAESQSFLGDLYRFGRAVKQDYSEAIRWYEKSATRNYPHALYVLAVLHGQGRGTPADRVTANAYYERAAAAGHPEAKKYLTKPIGAEKTAERLVVIQGISTDPEYGYDSKKPVHAGSAARQRAYLDVLRGPNGEKVTYTRTGGCAAYKDLSQPFGQAIIDCYQVSWEGLATPKVLFINLYKSESLWAPQGFTEASR